MTRTRRIIPIEQDQPAYGQDEGIALSDATSKADNAADDEVAIWLDEPAGDAPASRADAVIASLVVLALAGWTGLFAWVNQDALLQGGTPRQWSEWIVGWTPPALLCLVVLLVAMRTSRREAARFGDIARMLSDESQALEQRLRSVNSELSLAREFIAAQSRDLEALGRIAVDRLSGSASQLAELVVDNGNRIDSISTVSHNALENMEKLRGQLPVIANAAKDVTNNIGNAGRTAHAQLENMVAGFQRLNEFGVASERQVQTIRDAVSDAIEELSRQADQLADIARNRLAALADEGELHRQRLDQDEVAALAGIRARASALAEELAAHRAASQNAESEAIDSLRERLATLREESGQVSQTIAEGEATALAAWKERADTLLLQLAAFDEQIAERRTAAEALLRASADNLEQKLSSLDQMVSEQQQAQLQRATEVSGLCADIGSKVSAFTALVDQAGTQGQNTAHLVETVLASLETRLINSRDVLSGTDRQVADLTDASVRLLELIQASSDHARRQIPDALGSAEAGLSGIEQRISDLADTLSRSGDEGRNLADHITRSRLEAGETLQDLIRLQAEATDTATLQEQRLVALFNQVQALRGESLALAGTVEQSLATAINELTQAARKAGDEIGSGAAQQIARLASKLAKDSKAALASVIQTEVGGIADGVEQTISGASAKARAVTVQLRDQLAKVDELAGNLESRVTRARERAQEQIDSDFARRVALITESLNSTAIDITKVLDTEVADTAWAAYMRGDRGIFSRRAVSLLDSGEAKAVLHHYERDHAFREHVNHYIHDFEGMLRQLLSTRDGNALGVTLLSSDMGKLYVALAQAIERLRT